MTQKAHIANNYKISLWLGSGRTSGSGSFYEPGKDVIDSGKPQIVDRYTRFKKAEAVDATPQDLSALLRWAGGVRVLAGPATLD
ncbi:hypothetical protein [Scytonema sp. NUACC21]